MTLNVADKKLDMDSTRRIEQVLRTKSDKHRKFVHAKEFGYAVGLSAIKISGGAALLQGDTILEPCVNVYSRRSKVSVKSVACPGERRTFWFWNCVVAAQKQNEAVIKLEENDAFCAQHMSLLTLGKEGSCRKAGICEQSEGIQKEQEWNSVDKSHE